MKITIRVLLAVAAFTFGAHSLSAEGGYSFALVRESKKLGQENSQSMSTTRSKEDWAYKVTIENKSFKDAENIEIKYIIFMQPAQIGKREKGNMELVRNQGEEKVPVLKNFEKYSFVTQPVTRECTKLKAGWYYTSGASARAKDSLSGLWVRIFVGGKQVMESVEPPSLKTKEPWEQK